MTRKGSLFLIVAACVAALTAPAAFARAAHQSGTTVTVQEAKPSEFSFTLSTKAVKPGSITFKITNMSSSGLAHDFKICTSPSTSDAANSCTGKGTSPLGKGASASLTVTLAKPGKYEYLCTVPGHAAGGMKGLLTVT
jgi:nitrite reductase (NO-forming)